MLDITAGMRQAAALGLALAWSVAGANTAVAAGATPDSVASPAAAVSAAPRPTASAPT
jgi:hypothetical protein